MRKTIFTLFISIFSTATFSQTSIQGLYVGFEKICWSVSKKGECMNYDTKNPDRTWFYENTFYVKGDSIFFSQRMISVNGKDTSNGAIPHQSLQYRGTWRLKKNKLYFDMSAKEREKHFVAVLTDQGFRINETIYRKRNF